MSNNLIKSNSSNSIAVDQPKNNFLEKILEQVTQSINRFNFINSRQWILILIMNTICILFMISACIWVS